MKHNAPGLKSTLLSGLGLVLLVSTTLVANAAVNQDVVQVPDVPGIQPSVGWSVYCESTPNSTGLVSGMHVTGSLSIAANDTWIHSTSCPPGEYGIFLYGQTPAQLTWGDGVLCISPFSPGVIRLTSPEIIPFTGTTNLFLDMDHLPVQVQIVAGTTGYYQCMFRDPTLGDRFNLSDAVAITFGL